MYITTHQDNLHQAKLASCGILGIWVGYAHGHPADAYCVFYPKVIKFNEGIDFTREVMWWVEQG